MTEEEWLSEKDPKEIFQPRLHKASMRKTRLLVCAYCRHIWDRITHPHRDFAVAVAERYADGEAAESELFFDTAVDANRWREEQPHNNHDIFVDLAADGSVSLNDVIPRFGVIVRGQSSFHRPKLSQLQLAEREYQNALLRDILGNPFRPITLNPSWLTSTVLALATGIYEERAFDRMPILANALQEASLRLPLK
jgi:hypothetical protein